MKAWMGFTNSVVYCKPAVADDVLLRVWEYDPAAQQAAPFKPGIETIKLSAALPVITLTAIRNRLHDLNGVHIPTAAEIESNTVGACNVGACYSAPGYTPPAPIPPALPTAIIVYTAPVMALTIYQGA